MGARVGCTVGMVGEPVGASVAGVCVGEGVSSVGARVGRTVGMVGERVGAGVGAIRGALQKHGLMDPICRTSPTGEFPPDVVVPPGAIQPRVPG